MIAVANLFVNISFLGGQGQTLGKKVAGIKLVHQSDHQPIGFWLAWLRAFLHIADVVILYIGLLMPLWDVKRQTIADKIIATVVVKAGPVPAAYQPQYGQQPRQW
jgi:uncharacterized RDD family membrane protein YckC